VLKRASLVVANSQNTRSLLERWSVPAEKIRVLHPGADTRRFVPAKRSESIRATLGWSGRTVILTAGRLQRRKGQDMLIRSLSAIRRAVPDVLCSIVGDGDDREYLRELARSEGVDDCVEFRGEPADEELIHCYQQCDLFVLANRRVGEDIEGFGMVLVEAQACGKPVIAGDSGGTRETMSVGETGQIVDCTLPNSLADAIIELLEDADRREAMGRAARDWAVAQFDWETLASQAAQIFAELTRAHKSTADESSHEPTRHPSSVEARRIASLVLSAPTSPDRPAEEY
jgi:phosphatidylinositol alpha-1,6-mannosyltransferase